MLLRAFAMLSWLAVPAWADLGPNLDAFVAAALTRGLGNPLISVTDESWNSGEYSLTLTRIGHADIRSAGDLIEARVPLRFEFTGQIKRDLLVTELDVRCDTEFETEGAVFLDFRFREGAPNVVSTIELPIPEADVDCGLLSLPVQGVLEELVKRSRPDWEERLDSAIRQRMERLLE